MWRKQLFAQNERTYKRDTAQYLNTNNLNTFKKRNCSLFFTKSNLT